MQKQITQRGHSLVPYDFSRGLRVQSRVLLALMLREARTRYGRQRASYAWALVEPVLHILTFYVIFWYTARNDPLGQGLFLFLATGFGTYFGFSGVLERTDGGYESNEALLSFPLVKVIDVFLGRALLELATWVVVTFILLGTPLLLGFGLVPNNILIMLGAMLAVFAIGFGIGTCIGILSVFLPSFGNLLRFPLRVLYFTSGTFYLPDSLPPVARDAISWNPVLHGITWFREGYYPHYESHMLDLPYLLSWSVASLLLALVAERASRKALRSMV